MNRLEQSKIYLRQYLRARRATPWIVHQHANITDRAVDSLQDLDGIAGDWNTNRSYCYYYYPQRTEEYLHPIREIEKHFGVKQC